MKTATISEKAGASVAHYSVGSNGDGETCYINRYADGRRETLYDEVPRANAVAMCNDLNAWAVWETAR